MALPALATATGHVSASLDQGIAQTVLTPLGAARGDATTLTGVSCVSPAIAWACGLHNSIYRTTDGGSTWTRLSSPLPDQEVSDIEFVSATTGWAIGVNNAILRTTNGGSSWSARVSQGWVYPPYLLEISAVDATHAWIGGYSTQNYSSYYNVVLRTSNGTDWHAYPAFMEHAASAWGVTGIDFPDRLHGWGVISGGGYVFCNDGGGAWTPPIDLIGVSSLADVSFSDATHGWAVGQDSSYDPLIIHTSDGKNWFRQAEGLSGLDGLREVRAVWAVNQNVAWAACAGGYVLKTEDGGSTWAYERPATSDLNAVAAATTAVAWVVGDGGTVVRYGPEYKTPKPVLSKLKPASGRARSAVTLYGRGFGALREKGLVTFGARKAAVKTWSDTRIRVTVPAGTPKGSTKVKVKTAGGVSAARVFLRR
jgi:photosystem II stability/assembly factor-like uncharacterized protein